MHWRAIHKVGPVEAHLGDVIGEPMLARRPYPRKVSHPRWVERGVRVVVTTFGVTVGSVLLIACVVSLFLAPAHGRDLDGRYAQSDLKSWFNNLRSGKGNCCSLADGVTIKDVDWDTDGTRYRVRLECRWIDVPDDALVTEPNRYGPAVVWPFTVNGVLTIRCFMPGAMT